ncbi:hypothetical protein HY450_02680 [Candidatus Pacearchaeota archaeon]|nr:hypothetical protein [Candidatus Pacearchaeota archaeon]
MRTSFIKNLEEMAEEDEKIYLLTGDLGFSVLENFQRKFPKRYYNIGVAEQAMSDIAAGLALSGRTVFTYSIASFATMRCFEQIRNDIAYHNLKVRIVGVGSGFSYSSYGLTHHSLSDISLMRSLPNMTVIAPGDPFEVDRAMKESKKINGPIYLRLGKKGEPILHKEDTEFAIGKGIIIREGQDATLISTGNMLESTLNVREKLLEKNISARVISMHTIKPIDKSLILESAEKTGDVYSVEEHNIIGGLGSAVAEVLSESNLQCRFHRFGVRDRFCECAGDTDYVRGIFGISEKEILKKILSDKNKNES